MANLWEAAPVVQPTGQPAWQSAPVVAPPRARPPALPSAFGIGGTPGSRLLDPNANFPTAPVGDTQTAAPDNRPYAAADVDRALDDNPVGDALAQGGFRAIADTLGVPFDLTNLFANAGLSAIDAGANVFGKEIPFRFPLGGVSDAIANKASDVFGPMGLPVEDPAEMTNSERIFYNTGRIGGGAALQGGLFRSVGEMRPASDLPRRLDPVVKPYEGPGGATTIARDTAAGAGAGATLGAYENVVGEENLGPFGALLSMLAGGVGGATLFDLPSGGAKILRQIGRTLTDRAVPYDVNGLPTRRGDVEDAARYVQGQANTSGPTGARDALAQLDETEQMATEFGMPMPPIGQATQNIGLAQVERAIMNDRGNAPLANRNREVNEWATEQIGNIAESADPRGFVDAAGQQRDAALLPAQTAVQTAQGQAERAGQDRRAQGQQFADRYGGAWYATDGPGAALGEAVVDRSMVPTLERSSQAFRGVDPERAAAIDATPLVELGREIAGSLGNFNRPEKVLPRGLLARIEGRVDQETGAVAPTTIGDLTAAIPEIAATERRIRASANPDWNLLDNLRALREGMQGLIRGAAGDTGQPMAPRRAGAASPPVAQPAVRTVDPAAYTPASGAGTRIGPLLHGSQQQVGSPLTTDGNFERAIFFTPREDEARFYAGRLEPQDRYAVSEYGGIWRVSDRTKGGQLGFVGRFPDEAAARQRATELNATAEQIPGGQILTAYVNPRNPTEIDMGGVEMSQTTSDAIERAREAGHDLVILRNYGLSGKDEWAVLDPSIVEYENPPWGGAPSAAGAAPSGPSPSPNAPSFDSVDPTTDAARRWVGAQQNWEDTVAPFWNQRDAAEQLKHDFNADRFGRSQIPASGIPGRFIREPTPAGGQREDALSLERVRQGTPDPAAATTIDRTRADLIMGRAADSIMQNGRIEPMRLAGFIQRWGPVIDTAPGLRQQFDRLLDEAKRGEVTESRFTQALAAAQGTLKQTETEIADSALAAVAGRSPQNAIRNIAGSRDPAAAMTDLRTRLAGVPGAQESLERAVADYLLSRITNTGPEGNLPISWAKVVAATENPDTTAMLAAAFDDPEAMNALQRVRRVFDLRGILKEASGAPGSATASNMEGALRLFEAGLRTVYGGFRGGNIARNLKIAIGPWMRGRNNPVQDLVARAAVDPRVARHLLSVELRDNPQAWGSKMARLMRWEEFARQANEDWEWLGAAPPDQQQ
jgi:hypothetical protein